jgi:hypothetical protein
VYRFCEIRVTFEGRTGLEGFFWIANLVFFMAGRHEGPGNAPGPSFVFVLVFVFFVSWEALRAFRD